MKTERKKLSMAQVVGETQLALKDLLVVQPSAWMVQARARMQNLPKTNFDLGCDFADQGKWMDALFRFRVAAYFQPAYPQVWYNIGCCYFRLGKYDKAKDALLKALAQKPGQQDAIFMLATIDANALPANQRPTRMPASMVSGFFSAVAEGYDIVEAGNKYQAGKVIHDLLKPLCKVEQPAVLDLGCGTGIVSRPWRQAAKQIVGVDITPAMVALANKATHVEKKLFDTVIEGDIITLPAQIAADSADVALCVNVAPFVGDLGGLMQGAARALAPQGVLVVTYEPFNASSGFGLMLETGRFGHSTAYVKQAANAAGLTVVKEVSVQLYPDVVVPTFVFSKGGN